VLLRAPACRGIAVERAARTRVVRFRAGRVLAMRKAAWLILFTSLCPDSHVDSHCSGEVVANPTETPCEATPIKSESALPFQIAAVRQDPGTEDFDKGYEKGMPRTKPCRRSRPTRESRLEKYDCAQWSAGTPHPPPPVLLLDRVDRIFSNLALQYKARAAQDRERDGPKKACACSARSSKRRNGALG